MGLWMRLLRIMQYLKPGFNTEGTPVSPIWCWLVCFQGAEVIDVSLSPVQAAALFDPGRTAGNVGDPLVGKGN